MSKAVDRRARALPGEYRRTLARLDRQLHGTVEGQAGPLEVRLEELVGDDGLQCLSLVEIYDPATGVWQAGPTCLTPHVP